MYLWKAVQNMLVRIKGRNICDMYKKQSFQDVQETPITDTNCSDTFALFGAGSGK